MRHPSCYSCHKPGDTDATDIAKYDLCLDLHLGNNNEDRLRIKLYEKKDDVNFPSVNLLHLMYIYLSSSDIPELVV
jgi:cytosine/adenosine deaminase-related metal-dependent hydrolase